jgi:hypothetical protein
MCRAYAVIRIPKQLFERSARNNRAAKGMLGRADKLIAGKKISKAIIEFPELVT